VVGAALGLALTNGHRGSSRVLSSFAACSLPSGFENSSGPLTAPDVTSTTAVYVR